ncbi:MAG: glycosyl transferase family 1 [Bacteroidetes bacterium]|nr:MAG: glycosyl transferase family 1 [Bacteroidota bacterium]
MKVLHIGTHARKGGAGVASYRLVEALRKEGVDARMLVQDGAREGFVETTGKGRLKALLNLGRFILERLSFWFREGAPELRFLFSPANFGTDISRHPEVRSADVLHLHWINGAFLSLRDLSALFRSGKPVVWTLHDMWAFTGGCHYALECRTFEDECGNCLYLKHPSDRDLSHRVWKAKAAFLRDAGLQIVCPSRWLKKEVRASSLLGKMDSCVIPNPIDKEVFRPMPPEEAWALLGLDRSKKYILFGAATVGNMLKGFKWFKEAMALLLNQMEGAEGIEILVLGKSKEDLQLHFPVKVNQMAYTGSEERIVAIYSAAHLFVIPSLADNLPNTIVEAMLCGTPVVGFDSGGIAEMIPHLSGGYLARRLSAEDLAGGMRYVLEHPEYEQLAAASRQFALEKYVDTEPAKQYAALYARLLNKEEKH